MRLDLNWLSCQHSFSVMFYDVRRHSRRIRIHEWYDIRETYYRWNDLLSNSRTTRNRKGISKQSLCAARVTIANARYRWTRIPPWHANDHFISQQRRNKSLQLSHQSNPLLLGELLQLHSERIEGIQEFKQVYSRLESALLRWKKTWNYLRRCQCAWFLRIV